MVRQGERREQVLSKQRRFACSSRMCAQPKSSSTRAGEVDDFQDKAVGLEFEKVSQPAAYRGECCVVGAPGAPHHSHAGDRSDLL